MPMEKVLICIIVIWFHNGKMLINKFSTLPFILFYLFFWAHKLYTRGPFLKK